jgi:1-acyl-sn-glycerol-3-phosphate acyltransferase
VTGPRAAAGIGAIGRVRIALRLAAMLGLLVSCVPLHYLWKPFTAHNPWPRRFLGGIVRISGVRVSRVGGVRRQGAFLLANHVSWIDIPALAGASGCAFVAHDGLASVPLLRWLCALNDTVFIARHDRASIAAQVEQVREALRDTGALAIFPEGTTSDGTSLLPFKSSLLSALDPPPPGIAVQPVLLDYGADAAEIAWVGEEHGLANFLRILARPTPVRLTLRFLEPLAGDALAGRKAMAAAASAAMMHELAGLNRPNA